jgi:mono/diheme cytochrome c family protein
MNRVRASVAATIGISLCVSALEALAADDPQEMVKRGTYLINGPVACANCHTPRGPDMSFLPGMDYAGGFKIVDPAFEVYSANITPDKETGIGGWTDAQIITAIREGKTREGRINFPPMPVPTYNNMSDDDVKAIVAFLRTVKPVRHQVPESKYKIPQQAMPPAKGLPAPPASDRVAYGRYIVTALAHCFECHTGPDAKGEPDFARLMGAGGFTITLAPGMTVRTANITPDPETGIGKWSDADIKKALTEGVRPDGRHLSPPMPYPFFKNMTSADLDAVIAFLRTIPPIRNAVERTEFQKNTFK